MGKTFQAAQLTHERFLTLYHSCEIFFWYLPNWPSTESPKFGSFFLVNKVIRKLKLSKNVFYKKCGPEFKFFNEKKLERFRRFLTENWLWKSDFCTFLHILTTVWKFSWADIKKIFRRSDLGSKISHVLASCAAWNVFPLNLLLTLIIY